jgi:hypothetical protein
MQMPQFKPEIEQRSTDREVTVWIWGFLLKKNTAWANGGSDPLGWPQAFGGVLLNPPPMQRMPQD